MTAEHDPEAQEGLDLRHYLDVLRRRRLVFLIVFALTIGVAAVISYTVDPTYRASTKVVVGQGNSLFQPGLSGAIEPFTATMRDLAESVVVAERISDELDLNVGAGYVLHRLNVSYNPSTAVLDVETFGPSPEVALAIARAFGTVFPELVKERFGQQVEGSDQPPLTATVWDEAHVGLNPVKPQPIRNLVIAGSLGLILGIIAAFLADYFDRSIRRPEVIEQTLGVPVIGQIPFDRAQRRSKAPIVLWNGYREGAEAYLALRANLQYLAIKRPLRTILITSPSPEQGKTTVTANLAVAIARSGASTVVVEADLRRPRLNEAFGLTERTSNGLTGVLVGSSELRTSLLDIPVSPSRNGASAENGSSTAQPQGSQAGHIRFLQSGPLPPNPSELLSSPQMVTLLEQLEERSNYVLIDSPPLLLLPDALELSRIVDGVILVMRRNRTTTVEAREIRTTIDRLGIHLIGVVFTDAEPRVVYGQYYETHNSRP